MDYIVSPIIHGQAIPDKDRKELKRHTNIADAVNAAFALHDRIIRPGNPGNYAYITIVGDNNTSHGEKPTGPEAIEAQRVLNDERTRRGGRLAITLGLR